MKIKINKQIKEAINQIKPEKTTNLNDFRIPDINIKPICNVLSTKATVTLCAPQRGLSTGTELANLFIHDVNTFLNSKHTYNLSSLILAKTKKSNYYEIIDGQQRITSGLIFLTVIRYFAENIHSQKPNSDLINIKHVCNTFLFNPKRHNKSNGIYLQINDDNNNLHQNYPKFLKSLIDNDLSYFNEHINDQYYPIHLLSTIYLTMRDDIDNLLEDKLNLQQKVKLLKKLLFTFLVKFFVVIEYQDPHHTYTDITYDATNNRNAEFTVADKVKSRLVTIMDKSSKSSKLREQKWTQILNKLQGNSNTMSKFLSSYWKSHHGQYTSNELAKRIRSSIKTPDNVDDLLNNLYPLSSVYRNLIDPDSKSAFKNSKLNIIFKELNQMRFKQYYPLILSLCHRKYPEKDIFIIMLAVLRIEINRQIRHANHTQYAKESHKIWKAKPAPNINKIIDNLNHDQLVPSDQIKTRCALYTQQYTNRKKQIFILSYMIAKVYKYQTNLYKKKGDFNKYNSIYKHIFKNRDIEPVYILKDHIGNNINNLFNNICNWTLLETNCIHNNIGNIKKPNFNDMKKALSESNLESNHNLLTLLESVKSKNNNNLYKARNKLKKIDKSYNETFKIPSSFYDALYIHQKHFTDAFINAWNYTKKENNNRSNHSKI